MDGGAGKEGQNDASGGGSLSLSSSRARRLVSCLTSSAPRLFGRSRESSVGRRRREQLILSFPLFFFCSFANRFSQACAPLGRLSGRETFSSLAVSYLQWAWSECYELPRRRWTASLRIQRGP